MQFSCPQCNKQLRVPDSAAGKKVSCPNCQCVFTAPELSESEKANSGFVDAAPESAFQADYSAPKPGAGYSQNANEQNPQFNPDWGCGGFSKSPKGKDFYTVRHLIPSRVGLCAIISDSWNLITTNFLTCFLGFLIFAMITGACNMVTQILGSLSEIPGVTPEIKAFLAILLLCFTLINFLVNCFMSVGCWRYFLTLLRGQKPEIELLFSGWNAFGRSILTSFLTVLIIAPIILIAILGAAGIFAAINPEEAENGVLFARIFFGFIMAMMVCLYFILFRLSLALPLVADTSYSATEAIAFSWKITKGNVISLLGLVLFSGVVALLGLMACCVGMFFAIPYCIIMFMLFYLQATGQPYTIRKCE